MWTMAQLLDVAGVKANRFLFFLRRLLRAILSAAVCKCVAGRPLELHMLIVFALHDVEIYSDRAFIRVTNAAQSQSLENV